MNGDFLSQNVSNWGSVSSYWCRHLHLLFWYCSDMMITEKIQLWNDKHLQYQLLKERGEESSSLSSLTKDFSTFWFSTIQTYAFDVSKTGALLNGVRRYRDDNIFNKTSLIHIYHLQPTHLVMPYNEMSFVVRHYLGPQWQCLCNTASCRQVLNLAFLSPMAISTINTMLMIWKP